MVLKNHDIISTSNIVTTGINIYLIDKAVLRSDEVVSCMERFNGFSHVHRLMCTRLLLMQ